MTARDYGKPVRRLIAAFPEGPLRETYAAAREDAYQRIAKAYTDAGQLAPSRMILSGELL